MNISNQGLNLIKLFEGYRDKAYKCAAGKWTCGYGHTRGVTAASRCNQNIATQWLIEDCAAAENEIATLELTQNQFDALVSLIFNIGVGNWRKSTLRHCIAQKADFETIKFQWLRWRWVTTDNGREPLLLKRRECEIQLYAADARATKKP